ncbi:hypothetical protein [Bradyrhizobium sp. USDA 4520]
MNSVVVFLVFCFGIIAVPYVVGKLLLGRDTECIEALSFGWMVSCGSTLIISEGLKIALPLN